MSEPTIEAMVPAVTPPRKRGGRPKRAPRRVVLRHEHCLGELIRREKDSSTRVCRTCGERVEIGALW